ncbi:MAG: hypothetical protein HC854_07700, partial [Flavobacterium sp.]|nr:hypothetical protein [Flavobacterium sp.]
ITFESSGVNTLTNTADSFKWRFTEQENNPFTNGTILEIKGTLNSVTTNSRLNFNCCPVENTPCLPNDIDCDGIIINDNCPNAIQP